MALIRRVSIPAGDTVQVIPPDGKHRAGQYDWQVTNPTGSAGDVELVDTAGKTVGAGLVLSAGDPAWRTLARDENVYAANGGADAVEVVVTGTGYAD